MVTAGTTNEQQQSGLKLEHLTDIDMSKLSQSELHSLSLCSSSAFDLRRTDDLVIPNINRSLFNDSAASRRQTFSRPRSRRRPRLPHSSPKTPPSTNDPHLPENKFIVNFLKHLVGEPEDDPNSNLPTNQSHSKQLVCSLPAQGVPVPETTHADEESQELGQWAIVVRSDEKKRKRGRRNKAEVPETVAEIEWGVVNANGVEVDLEAMAYADDLYSAELMKRTVGLETEEGVLGFLRGLEGQWCSRRKRRKVVDASMFGDALPVGWKLVLALRRRDRRVSVYCRRYMRWSSW